MNQIKDQHQSLATLSFAALGVVYGDIGTSPLYAMREALLGLPINLTDVLGVLSLIFWSLIIVISLKYLCIVFRADNQGEGGILALLALLKRFDTKTFKIFFLIAIFGAGLILGDGMLTPSISVLSAVEGLDVISPTFSQLILPLSFLILLALFFFQSSGTAKISSSFAPIIFLWFLTISVLGIIQIIHYPMIIKAINPIYAVDFFQYNGWTGYILLGGVFLVVTGGEALYADMGHFGKNPIRISWFLVALPALLLNYFGQGAYLLSHPSAINNPFYALSPSWFSIPLLIIATVATVIASQAVISATFSITKQAVLLGLYPQLPIIQTSERKRGQIYVPQMNFILAVGTLILVVTFKNTSALAHAYGIAVNLDMLAVSIMTIYAARKIWEWNFLKIIFIFSLFLLVDLSFLGANSEKIITGGWVPIVFAIICTFIMYTWNKGMEYLRKTYYMKKEAISKILKQLHYRTLNPLPNTTAIFITDIYDKSGGSFLHFLKLSRTVPENILILSYVVENIPYVSLADQFECKHLDENVCQLILHYGFMDFVNIPKALVLANVKKILPFPVDTDIATYLVEIPTVTASKHKKTLSFYWQEKLFAFLMRNYSANINIEFYQLPYNRTIAIGTYCII